MNAGLRWVFPLSDFVKPGSSKRLTGVAMRGIRIRRVVVSSFFGYSVHDLRIADPRSKGVHYVFAERLMGGVEELPAAVFAFDGFGCSDEFLNYPRPLEIRAGGTVEIGVTRAPVFAYWLLRHLVRLPWVGRGIRDRWVGNDFFSIAFVGTEIGE